MVNYFCNLPKLLLITLMVVFAHQLSAADKATSAMTDWHKFSVFNPESVDEVQYGPYEAILRTLVDKSSGDIRMRYSILSAERPLTYLETYLNYLQGIPISKLNRDEQFAYWINLYNLGVIHLYVEDGKSARKVKKARGRPDKPGKQWLKQRFVVEGEKLSLEDIEQNILIGLWQDPNVLYGLSYGVVGSPSISLQAFRGKKVHEQLNALGKKFVNDIDNVRVKKKGLEVSSIYTWNKATLFGNVDKNILDHLHSLADRSLAQKISVKQSVIKDKFNWRTIALSPQAARSSQPVGMRVGGGS